MKKLKWWQIGLGVIVVNMLLPKDKKLFVFDPLNRGLYSPLLTLVKENIK